MVLKRKLPSRVEPPQQAANVPAPAGPLTNPPSAPPANLIQPEAEKTPDVFVAASPVGQSPVAVEPASELASVMAEDMAVDADDVADINISRPDDNGQRRRRDKKPRSFSSPVVGQPAETVAPAPAPSMVPQTDVEFDKVMERLSTLGVVAPQTDTLTQKAAPATAVAEMPLAPSVAVPVVPASEPASVPAPAKPSAGEPDWLAALTKELEEASKSQPRDARRDALGLPPPPTLPGNLLSGLIEDDTYGAPPVAASLPPTAAEPAKPAVPVFSTPTTPVSQSNVPWAEPSKPNDDWQLDVPAAEAGALPPSPLQPADIYAGVGKDNAMAPWQSVKSPPAELPGPRVPFAGAVQGGSLVRMVVPLAVLALVFGGAWWLVARGDKTQEQLARFTGSLRETTERLPAELGGVGTSTPGVLQPEQTITNNGLLPPPDTAVATLPTQGEGQAVIDFADVPPTEANKPIVADGSEDMPEQVSFVASLQKAIAEKKAEKTGEALPAEVVATASTGNTALDKTIQNTALKAQLDAELAAYRKALVEAGNVAEAPRPGDFLGSTATPATPYMNATTTPATGETAALLPPPAPASAGENPNNLPVLAEPAAEAPRVRTLEDFDVAMFEPEQNKVRIPRGIKPRMSTSDFPEMEVLSIVPGKGLIAYHNGAEGVLLLGESIEGWQLVQVSVESAEFRNGQRSYYVSAE